MWHHGKAWTNFLSILLHATYILWFLVHLPSIFSVAWNFLGIVLLVLRNFWCCLVLDFWAMLWYFHPTWSGNVGTKNFCLTLTFTCSIRRCGNFAIVGIQYSYNSRMNGDVCWSILTKFVFPWFWGKRFIETGNNLFNGWCFGKEYMLGMVGY